MRHLFFFLYRVSHRKLLKVIAHFSPPNFLKRFFGQHFFPKGLQFHPSIGGDRNVGVETSNLAIEEKVYRRVLFPIAKS